MEDAQVVYITVDGMGHTWAGGRSLLPERMVGKSSNSISATDVIWEFFRDQAPRRPAHSKVLQSPATATTMRQN